MLQLQSPHQFTACRLIGLPPAMNWSSFNVTRGGGVPRAGGTAHTCPNTSNSQQHAIEEVSIAPCSCCKPLLACQKRSIRTVCTTHTKSYALRLMCTRFNLKSTNTKLRITAFVYLLVAFTVVPQHVWSTHACMYVQDNNANGCVLCICLHSRYVAFVVHVKLYGTCLILGCARLGRLVVGLGAALLLELAALLCDLTLPTGLLTLCDRVISSLLATTAVQ